MPYNSDHPNYLSTPNIRMGQVGSNNRGGYNACMVNAKLNTRPKPNAPDWFLPAWMDHLHVNQASLARMTGWSIATTNDIYHGRTEYYRGIMNTAATALNIHPFELLMHPDDAMAMRQFRHQALRVAEASLSYRTAE